MGCSRRGLRPRLLLLHARDANGQGGPYGQLRGHDSADLRQIANKKPGWANDHSAGQPGKQAQPLRWQEPSRLPRGGAKRAKGQDPITIKSKSESATARPRQGCPEAWIPLRRTVDEHNKRNTNKSDDSQGDQFATAQTVQNRRTAASRIQSQAAKTSDSG